MHWRGGVVIEREGMRERKERGRKRKIRGYRTGRCWRAARARAGARPTPANYLSRRDNDAHVTKLRVTAQKLEKDWAAPRKCKTDTGDKTPATPLMIAVVRDRRGPAADDLRGRQDISDDIHDISISQDIDGRVSETIRS
ncbi:hypothetical protein EVAR_46570_1 [Eumeta japonica]|uniref:Uncharacterized protein n=1 Tax=Eumeta variegata TaxID=151549 RepID=A0A4C1WQQ1_EUMVA|nr:hypothetical protein EVAR_46570_1 [Eumeta japonica]